MQITLERADLVVDGEILLAGVDAGLNAEPDPHGIGLFLHAKASRSASRLVFSAGSSPKLRRYTVCHRYEPFWMKPAAGTELGEVPAETQFLLAELENGGWLLMVPLVDEPWRFSLRGHPEGRLELLAETGDPHVGGTGGLALFIAAAAEPFALLERGAVSVAARLGTGCLRTAKPLPDFVAGLGWCTWDAFYQDVSASHLRAGLRELQAGGVSPRFVILDDGWQSIRYTPTGERRLTSFSANDKFGGDLTECVAEAKRDFGVETFLVWHAMIGYWGGVDDAALPGYDVVEQPRRFGEGIMAHAPRFNEDWWGGLVGLVPEAQIGRFFDDYHRALRAQGVDGVKVDNQAVLEALGAKQGGRVRLTRAYRHALESSVRRHFGGRLINCMANAQETYYGSPGSTLTRTSIDFFPRRPETHAAHLYTNAHVGLWFGQFMHPDWDMFQSGHVFGAFHAAGRAVSGGPIYVSDKPGGHDFALLRKLVCSDGTVLLADGPGLPTADTLCVDPTRESVPLKIWNRSGAVGIVGAFHALYAAGRAETISGVLRARDVPGLSGELFACYAQGAGRLELLDAARELPFTLAEGQFEIFWIAPVDRGWAPLGLAGKLNGPAAITSTERLNAGACTLTLRDVGEFVAYSQERPRSVQSGPTGSGGRALSFRYDRTSRLLQIELERADERTFTVMW
jgi:raffinose synthase